jgi:hypothetical protein
MLADHHMGSLALHAIIVVRILAVRKKKEPNAHPYRMPERGALL